MHHVLRPFVFIDVFLAAALDRAWSRDRARGQATTEYVLVLLGVAAIAIAVGAWAARSGKVGDLLDKVFDNLADQVE